MELGDRFENVCPYCESENVKSWGAGPVGPSKNPYSVMEQVYTCRTCHKTFCVVNTEISYLE
jgi:transposase-like protein